VDDQHTTHAEVTDEVVLPDQPTLDRPSRAPPLRARGDTILDPGVTSELRAGTVIAADFVVSQRTLRGELGTVYDALQRSTGRLRSLKVLEGASARPPALRDLFFREARVTALVDSPHALDVIASGVDESADVLWIAFEQLTGDSLAARLTLLGAGVAMEPPAASELLEQLFAGLTAAHDAGVVHGDLKPANVFLAPGMPFTVKLLDFSVARAEGERDVTGVMGTPLWMAPEQAHGGPVTPATDVWSAGLLAFRLLTGRLYWLTARASVVETRACLDELLEAELVGASERAATLGCTRPLPEGFDAWFERCVARDPRRRFRSADEMSFAWRSVRCDLAPPRPRLPTQPAMPIATARAPQTFPPDDPLLFHNASEAPTRALPRYTPRRTPRGVVIAAVATLACAATVSAVALHRREARDAPERTSTPLTLVVAPPTTSWRERAAWQWVGTTTGEDGQWRFVLTLRRVEGARVRGSFAWTAVRAFTAEPGEQARETLEGAYDAATGAFDLRGVMSTDPAVLPVNRWRVTLGDDGSVRGATHDGLATLTGAPRR
jgi:serine/threonine protein kinase